MKTLSVIHPPVPANNEGSASRKLWARGRALMENGPITKSATGRNAELADTFFNFAYKATRRFLKVSGLYHRGYRNALDIKVRDIDFYIPSLPEAMSGYRILHLTDLHLDAIEGLDKLLKDVVTNVDADICFMTGDYRESTSVSCEEIMPQIRRVVEAIDCPMGIYAILGNHDTYKMVAPFEQMGVQVLVNETTSVSIGGSELTITGTDDVNCFYTEEAARALQNRFGGVKIALVHSPEMASIAARNGFALYLCGHTHGGQISLPGGRPIVTHLNSHRELARGKWSLGEMQGFTSPGIGTSGIPVRFFTRPEVTRITLRATTA